VKPYRNLLIFFTVKIGLLLLIRQAAKQYLKTSTERR